MTNAAEPDERAALVKLAARNNADWVDIICRSHGIAGEFGALAWTSRQRTPPLYPDAVTLDPTASEELVLDQVDTRPGCSVKDSFATLDLRPAGFRVLFEARWILRPAAAPLPHDQSTLRWTAIRDNQSLAAWVAAWANGEDPNTPDLIRPAVLDHHDVTLLGGYGADALMAGAILNRSQSVIGLSNLFTRTADPAGAWSGCLATAADLYPDTPIVGYESGPTLESAQRHGFTAIGPLRVWTNE